jgi:uncharacterized protein YbaR (Trm112 family)
MYSPEAGAADTDPPGATTATAASTIAADALLIGETKPALTTPWSPRPAIARSTVILLMAGGHAPADRTAPVCRSRTLALSRSIRMGTGWLWSCGACHAMPIRASIPQILSAQVRTPLGGRGWARMEQFDRAQVGRVRVAPVRNPTESVPCQRRPRRSRRSTPAWVVSSMTAEMVGQRRSTCNATDGADALLVGNA